MRRRAGFTITELLVSMALILFIMAILSEAFIAGLTTFRNMKAVGDMNARLRAVQSIMRDDMTADHFEGKRRTSDLNFWKYGPPQEGYLRVWHGSTLSLTPYLGQFYSESGGNPPDGVDSYYATDHWLQFTTKKRGNNRGDYYTAVMPPNSPLMGLGTPDSRFQEGQYNAQGQWIPAVPLTFDSQWAEVAYFLRPNGGNTNGLPLYTLFRRQRVVVPSTIITNSIPPIDLNYQWVNGPPQTGLPFLNNKPYYTEVSSSVSLSTLAAGTVYFNSPRDLTIPERRFGMNQFLPQPKFANLFGGIPLRSDNNLRYPIFALSSKNYVSPNYLPDDEDNAAALFGNGGNGDQTVSSEGNDVMLTDVISFAVIPIFSVSLVAATSANTVSGSTVLPFASTAGIVVGMTATGTNIPVGTTVVSVTPNVSVTLSNAVTGPVPLSTAITFTVGGIPFWDIDQDPRTMITVPSQNPLFSALGVHVFDTWSNRADDTYDYSFWSNANATAVTPADFSHVVPNTSVLTGLQISIRVWDAKTNQARQVTILVDM